MPEIENHYDAIVIGIGGIGSAALYHLARQGINVLGIEQYNIPHQYGSSHGDSRIFRLAHHERTEYVSLAQRALELWRDLEESTEKKLLYPTGSVHAGPSNGDFMENIYQSCEELDLEYEKIEPAGLNDRFPGYSIPSDYECLYQPQGGFLDSEQCITAHVEGAHDHNAEVRGRESVINYEVMPNDQVRVETDKNIYSSDKAIITTGAWASKDMGFLDGWLTPQRRIMAWFQPKTPDDFGRDSFPVFSIHGDEENIYGFPVHKRPGFKVGRTPEQPKIIDPDTHDQSPTNQEEFLVRNATKEYFTGEVGPTLSMEKCMVTIARDGHFIIGRHPTKPQLTIGAGFSGHGFKFCSIIGELLADVSISGDSPYLPEIFEIDRI